MDALSKVTRYVRDVYEGLQQGVENPTGTQGSGPKKEAEFEDLGDISCANHSAVSVPDKVQSSLLYMYSIYTSIRKPFNTWHVVGDVVA